MENLDKQNTQVKAWAGQTLQQVKNKYISNVQSPGRSGEGLNSLKIGTGKSFGQINRISLGFNRYLVWLMKGAGKGQGGSKGSSWLNKNGVRVKTNPASMGKMNTAKRKEKDLFNSVLEQQLPKLADIVADFKADQVVKTIQIK